MAKTARIILILMTVYVASIALPGVYRMAFQRNEPRVWQQYSEVSDKFIISGLEKDYYFDSDGNRFNRQQYEELIPVSAVHVLLNRGVFPDTVRGVHVTPEMAMVSHFEYTVYIPDRKNNYGIKTLTHGGTDRVGFIRTGDMMRVRKNGIEFYNCEDRKVDEQKSAMFDARLREFGYAPPDKQFSGSSGGRDRDDGLFFTDQNDRIFQVRYYAYEPVVNEIILPDGVKPVQIDFPGSRHSEIMGFVIGDDNALYIVETDGKARRMVLDGFDHKTFAQVHYMEHLFFRMIVISKPGFEKMFVYNKDYSFVDSHHVEFQTYESMLAGKIESFVFPAATTTETWRRGYIFDTQWNQFLHFIWLNLVLAIVVILMKRYRRQNLRNIYNILDVAMVAAFGILAFPGVFIFPSRE